MKKLGFKVIIIAMSLVMLGAASLFSLALKTNLALRRQVREKQQELQKVEKASKRLQEIGKKFEELKSREESLARRMPSAEKIPLGLFKKVIALASKKGISRVGFLVAKEPAIKDPPWQGGASGLAPAYVNVNAFATFAQFVEFLKELLGMERVVMIEQVSIGRDEKALPYQNITVNMTTYSFVP